MAIVHERFKKRCRRYLRPAFLGTLRRTSPISSRWGSDRGTPVDRYYIEAFLQRHSGDITGRVLEIKDNGYTREFGMNVEDSQILDVDRANSNATLIGDLSDAHDIPSDSFDCFILTQTLQCIYDVEGAIQHAHRILKPGGVLLATVPTVSRMAGASGHLVDYWRFTVPACQRLFGDVFGMEQVQVESVGNVLTAVAFLAGMAHEELRPQELQHNDSAFPLLVTVRAMKQSR